MDGKRMKTMKTKKYSKRRIENNETTCKRLENTLQVQKTESETLQLRSHAFPYFPKTYSGIIPKPFGDYRVLIYVWHMEHGVLVAQRGQRLRIAAALQEHTATGRDPLGWLYCGPRTSMKESQPKKSWGQAATSWGQAATNCKLNVMLTRPQHHHPWSCQSSAGNSDAANEAPSAGALRGPRRNR